VDKFLGSKVTGVVDPIFLKVLHVDYNCTVCSWPWETAINSNKLLTPIVVRFLVGVRDFSPLQSMQTGSGAHPASCSVGNEGSVPRTKWLWHEGKHSSPFSADVKKSVELYLHFHMPICFHGMDRGNLKPNLLTGSEILFYCLPESISWPMSWVRWVHPTSLYQTLY